MSLNDPMIKKGVATPGLKLVMEPIQTRETVMYPSQIVITVDREGVRERACFRPMTEPNACGNKRSCSANSWNGKPRTMCLPG